MAITLTDMFNKLSEYCVLPIILSLICYTFNMSERLDIATFNCTGFKSSREYISENLLSRCNLVALQETWLLPHELPLCESLYPSFCGFGTSAVDVGRGLVRGRPYGGLAWLWDKRLDSQVKVITFDSDRLLGLSFTDDSHSILMVNVYLPVQSAENHDEYLNLLGKIVSVIDGMSLDSICIVGDFNCNIGTRFYGDLSKICDDNNLVMADVRRLPDDTYTYLSDAHTTTSWLDHVCVSSNILSNTINFNVIYGDATSNHFPLLFSIDSANITDRRREVRAEKDRIKWDFTNQAKMDQYNVDLEQTLVNITPQFCFSSNCKSDHCHTRIDEFYKAICSAITVTGSRVFGTKKNTKFECVPGWNEFVREAHEQARDSFLLWRTSGSPREGDLAERMRRDRARFKLALRECRTEEARLRDEALAAKLASKDSKGFWQAAHNIYPHSRKIASTIDNASGEEDIANFWRDKYVHIFNSVDRENKHEALFATQDICEFIPLSVVNECLTQLPMGKSVGADEVPAEVLKQSSKRLRTLLSLLINACLRHCYLPKLLMRLTLIPLIKNKLKPSTDSDNYRLIAIASSISKLLELVILAKCKHLLTTLDNQFGFKKGLGTEMCIFVLKDIINYFNTHGSAVYLCFLDLRKAFDRVNHSKLFQKMMGHKVPIYLVKFIAFWYMHQELAVKWGNTVSASFKVTNGIRQGGLLSPFLFNLYVDKLSFNLNNSQVGCTVNNHVINHLSYADDMVLLAPSVRALKLLLSICELYALLHDIIYNTEKTECMICLPKKCKFTSKPTFVLQGDILKIVVEFKYLGFILTPTMSDDIEIMKRTRCLYAMGNTVINKFKSCRIDCKILMFKTYCYSLYCSALWSTYKLHSYHKVRVAHNDIFRNLLNVPRYHSASTLFAENRTNNLDAIVRNAMYSLIRRLLVSQNTIVRAVCRSGVRVHSRMWRRWSQALGVEWESMMLW